MNEYFEQIKVFPVPLQCEQNMTTMSAFVCVITQRRKYKQQIPSVIHKSQKNITSLLWDSQVVTVNHLSCLKCSACVMAKC